MTDYEAENLRTLFQETDLDHVPTTRDLISPAVGWGDARRRRDRWTAAGVAGAVAAVAVVGVVALRPDAKAGGTGPVAPVPTKPVPSKTTAPHPSPIVQQQLDTLRPYIPAGYTLTCGTPQDSFCPGYVLTSPTGATSIVQFTEGPVITQTTPLAANRPPLQPAMRIHAATQQIPMTDAPFNEPGAGYVHVYFTDSEAQLNIAPPVLADPTELIFDTADYYFSGTGASSGAHIQLSELVKDIPWKSGTAGSRDYHAEFGYNPHGPVLSASQFVTMANTPGFDAALRKLKDLQTQAMASDAARYQSQNSPTPAKH